jgi:RNA polymerase sigma factor CnrH
MTHPPPAPEASLIQRARRGDQAAFSDLVRRHQHPLYRFIRRYVGEADEAYDLLQETFVAAWESLARFDEAKPVGPWLRRIALNKCRDWSRRRTVRRLFFWAASLEETDVDAAAPDTESGDADAIMLARLDKEVADLPPSLKEPLLLTAFEGLSHQEAAAALNLTPKAVENRVRRARDLLAGKLAAQDEPPTPAQASTKP